jgi:tetratricopeptide (TPR) repeat protein
MSTRSDRIHPIWSVASLLLLLISTANIAAQTAADNTVIDGDGASIAGPSASPAPADKVQPTADNVPITAEQPASVAPPVREPLAELEDAEARYADSFAAEQYEQAGIAAAQMVTLTTEIYGSESLEYALAASDLAAIQSKTGDLQAAAANYGKAVSLIEEQEGIVAPQLIKPLMGLAAVQNAQGEWERGLETYNRALRLNHVELGLNNIEQMPIRDGLTESYLGLGSIAEANFQQEVQMRIVRDEFSNDLTRLTQASSKLADWYERSNQQEKEVWQLEMTVRTIRNQTGDDGALQIRTLRDLAAAYQRLDMPVEAELNVYNATVDALNEASQINRESVTPDPVLDAELQIEIGDVHNLNGESREARRSYTQAWQILTEAQADTDIFETFFDTPTQIGLINLPAIFPEDDETRELWRSNPDRFRPASLQALIDIDDYGRTENIRITETTPKNLLGDRALYLLKRYRYRPRFVNGQPVATINLPISHTFSYLPDETDVTDNSSPESSAPLVYPGVSD